MSRADQDSYVAEMARIGSGLGADPVPRNLAEAEALLRAMRPALRVDSRTREIARLILKEPAPSRALEPFHLLTRAAGVELLPDWARRLHGFPPVPGPLVRAGTQGLARTLRWAFT
jgi:uncharacterized protein (DUF2236 family)